MPRVLTSIFLLACAALALPAGAASIAWSGAGANTNWSNSANWQGGVVPGAADRAVFSGTGAGHVTVDAPVTLVGIDFSGDSAYALSGSLVTLSGTTPVTVASSANGVFSLSTGVTFTAVSPILSMTATVTPGPQLKIQPGLTTFSGGTVQVQAGAAPYGTIGFENVRQTAATAFVVSGNGAYFDGNNVISGPVTSNARSLGGGGVKPFGAASVVMNSGVLTIISVPGGTTIGPLTLQAAPASTNITPGNFINTNGPLHVQGTLNTSGTQMINALANITVSGKLGGSAAVEIIGSGTVELDGGGAGFNGVLNVTSPATLVFGASSAVDNSARLGSSGGSIVVGSTTQTIAGLSCGGPLEISIGHGALNVNGPVTANACPLTLDVPPTLSPNGTTYTVIANGGLGPLPMFTGVPDGAVLNVNGAAMAVSYHGGRSGNDLVVVPSSSVPPPLVGPLTDMWWGGAAENGWGLSLVQHSDTLFGALYVYDSSGNPVWLVMPGGSWDAAHVTYTGPLYQPIGSPYYAYDVSRFVAGGVQGSLAITFLDNNNATLDYSIGGNPGHKSIQRQVFGSGAPSGVDHADLWWGGPSQNGWGITILQQGMTLFPAWFTYDGNGKPLWFVMPTGSWNAAGDTYSGGLYRTTGAPWIGVPYDATKLTVINSGTYSIKFSGTGATFSYTADGHSGTMSLVREPF